MIRHFHWVRFSDVPKFEEKGWKVSTQAPAHHGDYSVLMIWDRDGEPVAKDGTDK